MEKYFHTFECVCHHFWFPPNGWLFVVSKFFNQEKMIVFGPTTVFNSLIKLNSLALNIIRVLRTSFEIVILIPISYHNARIALASSWTNPNPLCTEIGPEKPTKNCVEITSAPQKGDAMAMVLQVPANCPIIYGLE